MSYPQRQRKLIRLRGYDYRNESWYFVTICTKDRQHFFGEVKSGNMYLSDIGQICHDYWQEIPKHFGHVILGEMIAMPNHIHGIVGLFYGSAVVGSLKFNDPTTTNARINQRMSKISPKSGSLSHIIRTYKAACTHMIHQITDKPFDWQSRFHNRIIRDNAELQRIEKYIRNNPANWKQDDFFTNTTGSI